MQAIVLIHGLGANPLLMLLLKRHLQRPDNRVINWGYPSYRHSIAAHGASLNRLLSQLDANPEVDTVHLVTHSMGGIVARTALLEKVPEKMGRFVMLAPPNSGSRAARLLGSTLGRICQPLRELSCDAGSFVRSLAPPQGVQFGVITAALDFLVAPELTRLEGECDRTQIASWHSGILFRRDTAEQVRTFLDEGRFAKP